MRKIVVPPPPPSSPKDDNGAYEKVGPVIHPPDLSVDDLLKQGLLGIQRIMKGIMHEIAVAQPSPPERDVVMSLKDVVGMLHEIKKKEQDILDGLTDEQLSTIVKE